MSDRIINGIRLQVVADLATGLNPNATGDEKLIAHKSRNYLERLHRKGYAKEQCRLGFWRKIEQLAVQTAAPKWIQEQWQAGVEKNEAV